jgi:hypothetical protein
VYNNEFRYEEVPYARKPNLMFNRGVGWRAHLEKTCGVIGNYVGDEPVVVEIGCGEGHLLCSLAERLPGGRFIGFDPNASINTGGGFEARNEQFVAHKHLAEYEPDLVISRHVLEHLMNPLGFLQSMAFAAAATGIETLLYIEVPCIDRVFETGRTVDFYYEHNSQFTTESFAQMLYRSTGAVQMLSHGYNREVICGVVKLGGAAESVKHALRAGEFRQKARQAREVISSQLAELAGSGKRVAIWGGTGKAAAFMNCYGVDARRFPLVVDSDPEKAGTFVPGQGQEIRLRDCLLENPVDVILIPMQWRARDVLLEMKQAGITYEQILIEHEGRLADYEESTHPY